MQRSHLFISIAGVVFALIGGVLWWVGQQFTAPDASAEDELFVVSKVATVDEVKAKIQERRLFRTEWAFEKELVKRGGYEKIVPGGYTVSRAMDARTLATTLTSAPARVWVTIPEGFRKEQIAERLADALGWTSDEETQFVEVYTAMTFEKVEGYYFPDTYLLPVDESGLDIAARMLARFEEAFFPYYEKFANANIRYDTAVKVASIVQREAAGAHDMPLIAGILWNRLLTGMKLEVDATVQYVVGNKERGWWPVITKDDLAIDSPYNTYLHEGLPLHAISNPGLDAIDAVLNSEETECLYYLHDAVRVIHCAKTFEEHTQNIETYLR
ncbi:MAG: endolytic transglycosylase MltG [Candidatus Kerfeldbacteria bacterium]|nr:endolytic transglycosylase MltG [Candidatus Kerfeldbacteria bacterium]